MDHGYSAEPPSGRTAAPPRSVFIYPDEKSEITRRPVYGRKAAPLSEWQREAARKAAIEKSVSRYIPLSCGHFTSWDVDMLYRSWPMPRNKFYCEECEGLVKAAPKPKPDTPHMEPLF